jgi:hypothetical protein
MDASSSSYAASFVSPPTSHLEKCFKITNNWFKKVGEVCRAGRLTRRQLAVGSCEISSSSSSSSDDSVGCVRHFDLTLIHDDETLCPLIDFSTF